MADDEQTDQVVAQSRALTDLLSSLEDDLKKASSKNDNLLEAIESLEAKEGGEVANVVGWAGLIVVVSMRRLRRCLWCGT